MKPFEADMERHQIKVLSMTLTSLAPVLSDPIPDATNGVCIMDEMGLEQGYESAPPDPPPPDGGYGWVCVAAIFIINAFTWGVLASYGVFLAHYLQDDSFAGASDLDYALVGGFNFSMAMIVSPIATVLARKFGVKTPMFLGIFCQTMGFVTASFSSTTWQLYLSQGILVGLGVGFTWIPSIAVLPQWFDKKRSFANGICSAGSGIGGLIFSFAIKASIANVSLGWALRICGIVSGGANIIATVMLRTRNHIIQPKQHPFDLDLLRRYDVFLVVSWGFLSMLGYIPLVFSLSEYAKSIGLDDNQAAAVTALLNLGTAVGRPLVGVLSDRLGRIQTASSMTLLSSVFIFAIWIPATSYGVLILFAILAGGIFGVFWMTVGPVATEIVGLKELPSTLSLCWIAVVLPCLFGEVIALKLRRADSSRVFLYPQIFAGLGYVAASLVTLELWRVTRRKHQSVTRH